MSDVNHKCLWREGKGKEGNRESGRLRDGHSHKTVGEGESRLRGEQVRVLERDMEVKK